MATKIQMYGLGKGAKDNTSLLKEQQEQLRINLQNSDKCLKNLKNTRVFRHGIEKYVA